jgi:hypothetical protein
MLMTFDPAINGWAIFSETCRVMAKRLRDVCALPESEPLWRAERGFVVRDLPWTVEKRRVIPPLEFENWAVIYGRPSFRTGTVAAGFQTQCALVAAKRWSTGRYSR